MQQVDAGLRRGLDALWAAAVAVLAVPPAFELAGTPPGARPTERFLLAESVLTGPPDGHGRSSGQATSSEPDEAVGQRLIALVELARDGDAEAFGALYDHYQPSVYRFLYYRVGSVVLAEDLTSETFLRALRSITSFRWQGKDFGAWLTTIARNLATDHVKSGRARLEVATEDMTLHDAPTEGPENAVLTAATHEAVLAALHGLPEEQQECLVLRFLQSRSIADTAAVMGRSEGAVKQLQFRAVRNLAKRLPEEWR